MNKVCIACPTRGDISVETISFISKMKKREVEKGDVRILVSKGAPQNPNVNLTINEFLHSYKDCTHILLINDDLALDEGVIDRLLEHDVDIVGNIVNIWREDKGVMYCAFNGEHGKQIDIDFAKNPVGKCEWVGGGCMLIKREVLERFLKAFQHPIFGIDYDKYTGSVYMGSDERFCRYCRIIGYDVWYDARKPIPQKITVLLESVIDSDGITPKLINTSQGRQLTKDEVYGKRD